MSKKEIFLFSWLAVIAALITLAIMPAATSWSSPSTPFVVSAAPEHLSPTTTSSVTLHGGGFSPTTRLWLVPEHSVRTASTATLETFGSPNYLVERNDRLYVANGFGGLFILTGLQSATPSLTGVCSSSGQGLEFILHKDEAIMAAGKSGLQIIDIRDDANPSLLAELNSVAPALSVAGNRGIAYVASGTAGVQMVDVSNPRQPQPLGRISDIAKAYKVVSNAELLVVVDEDGGIIYDIRHPAKPQRLTTLPVTGGGNTVMLLDQDRLYWATKAEGGGGDLCHRPVATAQATDIVERPLKELANRNQLQGR